MFIIPSIASRAEKLSAISFFIPCFNCETTIREAILSISSTNLEPNDEIVACDDASTDGTAKVLEDVARIVPSLRILRHRYNRGGGSARNTAIDNAKNDLLFCLDGDNVLAPNSMKSLRQLQSEKDVDVACFGEIWFFRDDAKKITHKWIYKEHYAPADIFAGHYFPGCSGNYMFTRASWLRAGTYPESLGALDTWGFGVNQFLRGCSHVILSRAGYFHRYSHESYYVRDSAHAEALSLRALSHIVPYFDLLDEKEVGRICSRKERGYWYYRIAKRALRMKDGSLGTTGKEVVLPQA